MLPFKVASLGQPLCCTHGLGPTASAQAAGCRNGMQGNASASLTKSARERERKRD